MLVGNRKGRPDKIEGQILLPQGDWTVFARVVSRPLLTKAHSVRSRQRRTLGLLRAPAWGTGEFYSEIDHKRPVA